MVLSLFSELMDIDLRALLSRPQKTIRSQRAQDLSLIIRKLAELHPASGDYYNIDRYLYIFPSGPKDLANAALY